MPLSNASETNLLQLLFQNATFANIGSGLPGATTAGSYYIALHTSSPGAAGNQSTNEAAYTSYARVAIARTSGAFSVSGSSPAVVSNVSTVSFPTATGGSETETYFSIGVASSGATQILAYGPLTSALAVSSGITPSFATGQLQTTLT